MPFPHQHQSQNRIGKAVASPKRLELLALLCQGERTVEGLAREANLSVANTSQHLQVLRAAHLTEAEKRGLHVVYRIAEPKVADLFHVLCILAETQLAEVEQLTRRFFAGKAGLEVVEILRAEGFRVVRMEEGVQEWQQRGLIIEKALTPSTASSVEQRVANRSSITSRLWWYGVSCRRSIPSLPICSASGLLAASLSARPLTGLLQAPLQERPCSPARAFPLPPR